MSIDALSTEWTGLQRPAPEWFRDAKFGLFFHWGPYSVPAYMNEWYSRNMYAKGLEQNIYHEKTYGKLHDFGYKDFLPMWHADRFDPDEWADLVVRSGAKYAGPVTEHSDNFSMWNSSVNPVNAMNYGPCRDVVGECFRAFRSRGIRTLATFHHQWMWGWFMSTDNEADVYDPENEKFYGPCLPLETNRYLPYRYPDERFCTNWLEKINEVVDHYAPDVVYFDGRTCIIDERYRKAMVEHYYLHSGLTEPIITFKQQDFPMGTGVYDIECGRFAAPKAFVWQTDDRLENKVTWCYVQDPKYKPAREIIQQLSDVVAKNGNLLLNVGPEANGAFHPDAVRELELVGKWLSVNGEAIYGTRPFRVAAEGPSVISDENYDVNKIEGQIQKGEAAASTAVRLGEQDFRFTTKKDSLFVIAMDWPSNGTYHIHTLRRGGALEQPVRSVTMLGTGEMLPFEQREDGLYITVGQKPDAGVSVYAMQIMV